MKSLCLVVTISSNQTRLSQPGGCVIEGYFNSWRSNIKSTYLTYTTLPFPLILPPPLSPRQRTHTHIYIYIGGFFFFAIHTPERKRQKLECGWFLFSFFFLFLHSYILFHNGIRGGGGAEDYDSERWILIFNK